MAYSTQKTQPKIALIIQNAISATRVQALRWEECMATRSFKGSWNNANTMYSTANRNSTILVRRSPSSLLTPIAPTQRSIPSAGISEFVERSKTTTRSKSISESAQQQQASAPSVDQKHATSSSSKPVPVSHAPLADSDQIDPDCSVPLVVLCVQ